MLDRRGNRPLLLIDIAVPRDIEPEINFLDDVYVYNVDDLQAIADEYLRLRREDLALCDEIIADKAAGLVFERPRDQHEGESGLALEGGTS